MAKTLTVCSSCSIKSVKEGIRLASDFDTLIIKKGTYKEFNILVDKPLTILGENYPIVDGEEQGEIFRIAADNVTLDGLFIINVGTSYTSDYAAIRVVRSEKFVIQNVVLKNSSFGSIWKNQTTEKFTTIKLSGMQ